MPAIPQQWICDFPGCGITFLERDGYSALVYNEISGQAPIPSFTYPEDQPICCSLNHAYTLAASNLAAMKQKVIDEATAANFTLQIDPPLPTS